MRNDWWSTAGVAVYLGIVVTVLVGLFASPWIAAGQALVVGSMLCFAWLTK